MQSPSTVPSLFDTLSPKPRTNEPLVQEGDCGIILRSGGGVDIFSTGISSSLTNDPATWGEREHQQIQMGQKLMAISVALQNEQIMAILLDVTSGIIEAEQISDVSKH